MFSPDSFCVVREDLASGFRAASCRVQKKLFKGMAGLDKMLEYLVPDLVVCAT